MIGGFLGAGLMWLNTTKKGRMTRDALLDAAAEVYAGVKKKVLESDALANIKRSEYVQLVRSHVEEYARKHPLVNAVKDMIVRVVISQWKHLQTELKQKSRR